MLLCVRKYECVEKFIFDEFFYVLDYVFMCLCDVFIYILVRNACACESVCLGMSVYLLHTFGHPTAAGFRLPVAALATALSSSAAQWAR